MKNSRITKAFVGGLLAMGLIGGAIILGLEAVRIQPTAKETREVANVTRSDFMISNNDDHVEFDAYCVTKYRDGSEDRVSLGRYSLTGKGAKQIAFATDKCDTSR